MVAVRRPEPNRRIGGARPSLLRERHMIIRFLLLRTVTTVLVWNLLSPSPGHAAPQRSDEFSTSGEHDQFAVGNAHKDCTNDGSIG